MHVFIIILGTEEIELQEDWRRWAQPGLEKFTDLL
jgi:hypothetical protein